MIIKQLTLATLDTGTLDFGFVGENEHIGFSIKCDSVFDEYPTATASLLIKAPDNTIYPKTVEVEGYNVGWVITASDTAYPGSGQIQLTFTEDGAVVKTVIANTNVKDSLVGDDPPPDPIADWISNANQILNKVDGMTATAESLPSGDDPSVTVETVDGHYNLEFGIPAGDPGDPTEIIDDNAGVGDTTKVWSANKSATDLSELKSDIAEQTYNIWPGNASYSFTRYEYVRNLSIPAGTYTISVVITSEDTDADTSRIAFMNGSTQLAYKTLKRDKRVYSTFTLDNTCDTIILYAGSTSSQSTGDNATWANIMLLSGTAVDGDYLPPLIANDVVARKENNIYAEMLGYKKPNLIDKPFTETTIGNVALTVGEDWSIKLNGTANESAGTGITVSLLTGKYILNGISGGDTQTYWLRMMRADNSYKDLTSGEYEFEITESSEDIRLYVRVKSGAVITNQMIYPMIRDASIYNSTYAKYGEYAIMKPVQELIDYTEFNWSGKKMNALGDSIVKGSNGNFINVIGGILNLSAVRNYGIGGSCIASTSFDDEYPPAVTRYTEMDNDAQIIIVHAGTNDYTAQVPIGETNSQDITTWNGALNVLMTGLRNKYPTSLIIFSNILDRIQDNNPERYPIVCQTYRDALEAACRRNHMVFYNGFEELNFDFHQGYYDHILTVDGLHPNQAGANIMGRSIAGYIKWH